MTEKVVESPLRDVWGFLLDARESRFPFVLVLMEEVLGSGLSNIHGTPWDDIRHMGKREDLITIHPDLEFRSWQVFARNLLLL